MKGPDLDRERSEEKHTLARFLQIYNAGLPTGFPRASLTFLRTYQNRYQEQSKEQGYWSLDLHRKKFMDWLPGHLKALEMPLAKS